MQELVGHPLYTELVEGERDIENPQDNSTAAVGMKKLLIDVSNHAIALSQCSVLVVTLPTACNAVAFLCK